MRMKGINKAKILAYLSDPENPFLNRDDLATKVCGYSSKTSIYRTVSVDELNQIEAEAFEIRKKRSTRQRANVYDALYKEAVNNGNVQAAKEFLDRVEGKATEKRSSETEDKAIPIQVVIQVEDASKG